MSRLDRNKSREMQQLVNDFRLSNPTGKQTCKHHILRGNFTSCIVL